MDTELKLKVLFVGIVVVGLTGKFLSTKATENLFPKLKKTPGIGLIAYLALGISLIGIMYATWRYDASALGAGNYAVLSAVAIAWLYGIGKLVWVITKSHRSP